MVPMQIQIQKGKPSHDFFCYVLGNGFSAIESEEAIVDWHELVSTDSTRTVQMAEKLDTLLACSMLDLPFIRSEETSLATRNLERGNSFLLPGGDKVAARMRRAESEISKVMAKISTISGGLISEGALLWLYILAEAESIGCECAPGNFEKGKGLGPVGARIVAEVLIGLLEFDEESYLGSNRDWVPQERFNSIGRILAATNLDLF
jgi:hypothetical protein